MIDFIMNNFYSLLLDNCNILGEGFSKILKEVFMWIEIAVPGLLIILCSYDMVSAVMSQDDKNMKAAQGRLVKRIIIGVAIFFTPMLINFLLKMAGFMAGTCGVGGN